MTTTTPAVSTEHVGGVLVALAQHSFSAVMVTRARPTTPIVYVNVAFTALTGYTAEESVETLPQVVPPGVERGSGRH